MLQSFRLENSYISSTSDRSGKAVNIGAIASSGCGIIDTVYTNAIVDSSGAGVGGIIGTINATGKAYQIGGFIGVINGTDSKNLYTVKLENCLYTGTINYSSTNNKYYVGGLIGGVMHAAQATASNGVGVTGTGSIEQKTRTELVGQKASDLDFSNVWKAFDDQTPVLKSFYVEPQTTALMRFLGNAVAVVTGLFD